MARIERELEKNKRIDKPVPAAESSGVLAEWPRLQRKNLNKLGLPKRKEWSQCNKKSSWQEYQSRLCQREKKQSHLSRLSDCEEGVDQGERKPQLREKEEGQSESM